jgi:hypothetical protein
VPSCARLLNLPARRLWVPAVVVFGAMGAATAPATDASDSAHKVAPAVAARHLNLLEKCDMHLASVPASTLTERGTITGTFNGTVTAYITVFTISKGSYSVTAYFSGGDVTVQGTTQNRNYGTTGYAEGPGRITRGTGRFAHASSGTLQLKAWMNRRNFSITTEMHGQISM